MYILYICIMSSILITSTLYRTLFMLQLRQCYHAVSAWGVNRAYATLMGRTTATTDDGADEHRMHDDDGTDDGTDDGADGQNASNILCLIFLDLNFPNLQFSYFQTFNIKTQSHFPLQTLYLYILDISLYTLNVFIFYIYIYPFK